MKTKIKTISPDGTVKTKTITKRFYALINNGFVSGKPPFAQYVSENKENLKFMAKENHLKIKDIIKINKEEYDFILSVHLSFDVWFVPSCKNGNRFTY